VKGQTEAILASLDNQVRTGTSQAVVRSLNASKPILLSCFRRHFRSEILSKALTVKILNLCLAKHHSIAKSSCVLSRPYGLIVDPANGCNLACPGCVHSEGSRDLKLFDWKPGLLRNDRLSTFLRRFGPYAIQMMFYNYGEPLLNPDTPNFIRLAKSYLLQTVLSTHLSLERFDAGGYVNSGLDFMLLSIDGATQGVYEKFRHRGKLDLVLENLAKLIDTRQQLRQRTPVVCWQFLAFEHNVHEVPDAIDIARELGVDEFKLVRPFDVSWDDPTVRPANIQPDTFLFNLESERRMRSNWNPFPDHLDAKSIEAAFEEDLIHSPHSEPPKTARHTCRWLYKNMAMDANGRIFPCSGAPRSNGDLVYANLSATDPFNSDRYRRARLFFADRHTFDHENVTDPQPYCAQCEFCDGPADIDSTQIRQYLTAAGTGLFSSRSADILSCW
jgi:MoaA/NifB/PqqE/SkfB family radical SAM enzyme